MNTIRRILCLLLLLTGFELRADSATVAKPIVILISIDACRWDYLAKFSPPVLSAFAAQGVRAERMLSCFPSKTFPNHYSIATGLRIENHGIISNDMYDPSSQAVFTLRNGAVGESRWWGGEPIWVTARKQGLRTACLFWPGSEAEIKGTRPDTWLRYDGSMTNSERVHTVLSWLGRAESERPQIITLYFDIVDTIGHRFGPATPEVGQALAQVDQALGELQTGVHALGLDSQVNYIITSDHGMTPISTQRRITLDDFVDPESVQIDFKGELMGLRPLDGNAELLYAKFSGEHPHFKAYRRKDVPEHLHFSQNLRIPPVVLVPDLGWEINTRANFSGQDKAGWGNGGAHGYDPRAADMGATFIAAGPAFKSGVTIAPFENIHIYDLLCTLLDLQPAPNDGDHRLSWMTLKP
ncbi:MAG: ectonucleotide pyrophosphatase/phosphodiesterase [Cephaloticoccus sp.]|nr:ectonucleotide pyrophosphatase/phosphodiesterase [Cephaloticoccus sp.]MCF7758963.1 ectonucleotide pyrophosphatase/phosphodiesterase [Cephaloticoccus sp.]